MKVQTYESEREFYQQFPSRIYICSYCKSLTINPYVCIFCGKQANQLFNTDTFKFRIKNVLNDQIQQIFKPIEMKGEES